MGEKKMATETSRLLKSLLVLLWMLAAAAPSASLAAEVRPMFKTGYDTGGDTLVTAVFTDGSTKTIKANEGLYLGGGVSIVPASSDLEIEVSLSYKFQTITAANGDIDFTRIPLDALVFYRFPKARLGGGLTYHMNPKVKGSGVVGGLNVKFDDALGLVLQADYRITEKMAVGARYTSIEYEASGTSATAKSNGLGIVFSMSF
jgi:outer membrane protein with beta-barrel domain